MIELDVLTEKYWLKTKELLWYSETKTAVRLMLQEKKTIEEIGRMSREGNIFNASSKSRAVDIQRTIIRRLNAVNESFLRYFDTQPMETQLQLCIVMVMLTDRSFLRFMDLVFREKLIRNDLTLQDAELLAYFHNLQEIDAHTAKWTDAGMKKARDNYKAILKEAGLTSDQGTTRDIIRPIVSKETKDFLVAEGLERLYLILAGERE